MLCTELGRAETQEWIEPQFHFKKEKKKRKGEKATYQSVNNNFIVHSYVWSRVNLFIASSTLHGYGNRMTAQWIHSAMASQPTSPAMRSRTVLRTINTEYGVSTEYRPHS